MFMFANREDYQFTSKGAQPRKKIPITHNLRILRIKTKEYKGLGVVHNFMVEENMDYGLVNIAKFAR